MHLMTVPTRVLAALFSMTLAIALVPTMSLAEEHDDDIGPLQWDGRGTDSQDCDKDGEGPRDADEGWIHWIFSTKGDSDDATLTLSGSGSGQYDPEEPLEAETWHFYTDYFDLDELEASINLIGGEPGPGGGLVISDFCPGGLNGPVENDNGGNDDNDDNGNDVNGNGDNGVENGNDVNGTEDDDVNGTDEDDRVVEDDEDVTAEEDDDVTAEEDDEDVTTEEDDVTAEEDVVEDDDDEIVTPERVDAGGGGLTNATTASPALMAMLALGLGAVGGGAAWRLRRTPTA